MRIIRSGTAVSFIAGLVFAVAVPASAQSQPAQQIVTSVAKGSSITMPTGYSHYLYVGASSAGARIEGTSFAHESHALCTHHGQTPIGPSNPASSQGSFTTNGSLAAVAGVAVSGYSLSKQGLKGALSGDDLCGGDEGPGRQTKSGISLLTRKEGGVAIILISTEGIGKLSYSPPMTNSGQCNGPVKSLQNLTVHNGKTEGGAVAVLSMSVQPDSYCEVDVAGTTYFKKGPADVVFRLRAYLFVPDN